MKLLSSTIMSSAVLVLALACSQVVAKAPVWKVSKGEHHLYLGGTVHVLSETDYPLPEAFKVAFADSDKIVFETDMSAMALPETQKKMLKVIMFQDQRTLQRELSSGVYNQLKDFLAERQIPITNFSKFTPAGISITLTFIELQRLGLVGAAGVDAYYSLRAKDEGKLVGMLESVDEQIAFIGSMNKENSDKIIMSALRDLEDFNLTWMNILSAWQHGDTKSMSGLFLSPMQDEFPELYQTFLVKRNNAWLKKIKPMLNSDEIEFLLVGFLHMIGEDGLLTQLRASGYIVEQM